MRVKKKLVGFNLLQLAAVIAAILVAYYFDAKEKIQGFVPILVETAQAPIVTF